MKTWLKMIMITMVLSLLFAIPDGEFIERVAQDPVDPVGPQFNLVPACTDKFRLGIHISEINLPPPEMT
jgi:hypothetical protein